MTNFLTKIKKYLTNFLQTHIYASKKDDFLDLMYKAAEYSNREQRKIHKKAQEMTAM